MTDSWATSVATVFGSDLHLDLDGPGLRAGLAEALRTAVRTGRLAAGTRLPSSRSLAADLGRRPQHRRRLLRGTGRRGLADGAAGLRHPGRHPSRAASARARRSPNEPQQTHAPAPPGSPNLAEFPRTQWLAASRRALTSAPDDALGYGDPLGRVELRTVLAEYLARSRGVYAEPERVVISSGFHHGLILMAQVLRASTGPVGGRRGVRFRRPSGRAGGDGLAHRTPLCRRTGRAH